MGNLKNLVELDLRGNQLTGHFFFHLRVVSPVRPTWYLLFVVPFAAGIIPESMGNLGKLEFLGLDTNKLEGHFFIFRDGQSRTTNLFFYCFCSILLQEPFLSPLETSRSCKSCGYKTIT